MAFSVVPFSTGVSMLPKSRPSSQTYLVSSDNMCMKHCDSMSEQGNNETLKKHCGKRVCAKMYKVSHNMHSLFSLGHNSWP
mgnify:CR=1 FL=1